MAKIFEEIRKEFVQKLRTEELTSKKLDLKVLKSSLEILIKQQDTYDIEKGEKMTSLCNEFINFIDNSLKKNK